jgi:hypothetical protein
MSRRPIADYALLSDRHGAALVSRSGSVDWLCLPRFDAPALCARLLDEDAGHFAVTPRDIHAIERCYLPRSLVLETRFYCAGGVAVLRDALATGTEDQVQALGRGAPHLLLRELRCLEGEVEIDLSYRPRPEYGLIRPVLEPAPDGIITRGGARLLRLSGDAAWSLSDCAAEAVVPLRRGGQLRLALKQTALTEGVPEPLPAAAVSTGMPHRPGERRAGHRRGPAPSGALVSCFGSGPVPSAAGACRP